MIRVPTSTGFAIIEMVFLVAALFVGFIGLATYLIDKSVKRRER